MARRQTATARAHVVSVEQATTVDTTPRAMRGLLLATALSLPLWGALGLIVHGLWNLAR